jgi:hypothetical protein
MFPCRVPSLLYVTPDSNARRWQKENLIRDTERKTGQEEVYISLTQAGVHR